MHRSHDRPTCADLRCSGCGCSQVAEHAAWDPVRRIQAHPRFADCYALAELVLRHSEQRLQRNMGCKCMQVAEHAAWDLVRRTQAHPRFADCYALPSYDKCWRRLARRPVDSSMAPVLFGLDWCVLSL